MPATASSSVVLPAPLGPTIATSSPGSSVNDTASSTVSSLRLRSFTRCGQVVDLDTDTPHSDTFSAGVLVLFGSQHGSHHRFLRRSRSGRPRLPVGSP